MFDKAKSSNLFTLSQVLMEIMSQSEVKTSMQKNVLVDFAIKGLTTYKNYATVTHYLPERGELEGVSLPGRGSGLKMLDQKASVLKLQEWIYGGKAE